MSSYNIKTTFLMLFRSPLCRSDLLCHIYRTTGCVGVWYWGIGSGSVGSCDLWDGACVDPDCLAHFTDAWSDWNLCSLEGIAKLCRVLWAPEIVWCHPKTKRRIRSLLAEHLLIDSYYNLQIFHQCFTCGYMALHRKALILHLATAGQKLRWGCDQKLLWKKWSIFL